MAKELCKCGKMAVYFYMPGYEGKKEEHPFYCEDCISSPDDVGCSCNYHYIKEADVGNTESLPEGIEGKDWRWVDQYRSWINLDERGRPYPCAEYDYDKDGYDIPTWWTDLKWEVTWKWFLFKESAKRWWKRHIIDNAPEGQDF